MIAFAPVLSVLRVVPVWAWALAACLAWGAWQRHAAASATNTSSESVAANSAISAGGVK
jgi:hypothetical protein